MGFTHDQQVFAREHLQLPTGSRGEVRTELGPWRFDDVFWTLARWWGVLDTRALVGSTEAHASWCAVLQCPSKCVWAYQCVCVTSLRGQGVDSMHCRAVSGREPNIVLTTAAKPTQSWGVSGPILGTLFEQKWAPFLGARMGAVFWPNL